MDDRGRVLFGEGRRSRPGARNWKEGDAREDEGRHGTSRQTMLRVKPVCCLVHEM
jgi:hypothetical protein